MDLITTNFALNKMLPSKKNVEKKDLNNADGAKLNQANQQSAENFDESNSSNCSSMHSGFSLFLSMLIGFFAVYLSWRCNTASDMNTFEKIIWAFLSFVFSIPFLIYYILIRSHECAPLLLEYNRKRKL